MKIFLALLLLVAAAPVNAGRAVKIIEPLATGVVGNCQVVDVKVTLNDATRANFAKLEAKAAKKRADAGLSPVGPATTLTERPTEKQYATLPIEQMMPLIVQDAMAEWRLSKGRPVKLTIELDTLKTADGGMMMLIGSTDQLAGTVTVTDAQNGQSQGQFYVDVLNGRGGLAGIAMRGSGVREKLAAEFSKRIAQQLTGSKSKAKAKS